MKILEKSLIYKIVFLILFLIQLSIFATKININTASKEELIKLPGIGEVKAESIIEFRKQNGPFKNISDIIKVKGIGEKTFNKFSDTITVEDSNEGLDFTEPEKEESLMDVNDTDPTGRLNINTATLEDFKLLPGIGDSKAEVIIEHREKNGNFKGISELKKVKGIGDSMFEKIADFVTVKINLTCVSSEVLLRLKGIHTKFVVDIVKTQKTKKPITQKQLNGWIKKYSMGELTHFFVIQ